MGRTPCCSKEGLNRGAWTALEDKTLTDYISKHGEGRWNNIPKESGLKRCGKSCRLRWLNYLRPDIKRGNISLEEEDLIIRLHRLLGNRWALIAGRLPGRTDNEIKNYWNTTLGKKVKGEQSHQTKDVKKKKPKIESGVTQANALRCTKVHKVDDFHTEGSVDGQILVKNAAAVLDLKSSDSAVSFASKEYDPQNFTTDFNEEDEFLLSDISDFDLWKLCQFDHKGGTSEPWPSSSDQPLLFSEEMLNSNFQFQ